MLSVEFATIAKPDGAGAIHGGLSIQPLSNEFTPVVKLLKGEQIANDSIAIVSAGMKEQASGAGIVQKTLQKPAITRSLMSVTRRGVVLPDAAKALIAQFAAASGAR